MKKGLVIAGIIVLLVTFFVVQIYITPDMKSRMQLADSLCTAKLGVLGVEIPVGEIGQELLGEQENCREIHYWKTVISYGWIGYLIGAILLVWGLLAGKTRKEISRPKRKSKRR